MRSLQNMEVTDIRNTLYRPSWQRLRVSCLSVHHHAGGFTTADGTTDNLKRLDNYLLDAHVTQLVSQGREVPQYTVVECERMGIKVPEEYACRVWRVLNLLNATRMGYAGQGLQGSEMDEAVRQYRDMIQPSYDGSLVVKVNEKWNWDVVQFELEEMWRNDRYWFKAIENDLERRVRVSDKRRSRKGDVTQNTRPELLRFMGLMDAVNRGGS